MKILEPTPYTQALVQNFVMPPTDALAECLLAPIGRPANVDAGIFISTQQSEDFYTDPFTFWVRALFCFSEDTRDGQLLRYVLPFIDCRPLHAKEFAKNLVDLSEDRMPDDVFRERQASPESYVEFSNRSFSDAYMMVDRYDIRSAVALSDGEYIAYFLRSQINA